MYKAILENIIDRLYVGDEEAVPEANRRGYSILAACKDGSPDCHRAVLGYTALGAPKDANYYFYRSDVKHMALNLIDVEDPDMIPAEAVDPGLRFLKERYDAGDKVLSHCIAGHTRGPLMMLMFLRTIGEMGDSFLGAERKFRTLYSEYDPGKGMRMHARERWARLPKFFK
jgi:intein/homing endonuclease